MVQATARHFLNGKDVWVEFGLIISGGSASFLSMPKRKEVLSYDWVDENGLQHDLDTIAFEEKQVQLNCAVWAENVDQFWARRITFQKELNKPGWQTWRIMDHERDYLVRYLNETNPRKATNPFKGVGYQGVVFQFEIALGVDVASWLQIHGSGIIPAEGRIFDSSFDYTFE